jgi:hypothetical protein
MNVKRPKSSLPQPVATEATTDSQYPSPIYFQTHFEHLYQLINDLRAQVLAANHQIARIHQHLDAQSLPTHSPIPPKSSLNIKQSPVKKRG